MTPDRAYLLLAKSENAPAGSPPGSGRYHTVPPRGEYPSTIHLRDGKKEPGILVVDDLAFTKILAAFNLAAAQPAFPGLLVDQEHRSELPDGDTIAAAWAKTIEQRDDGLWTGWDLTPLGSDLLASGKFKFRSPVFNLEKVPGSGARYRPIELVSIGLTNKPHFKQLAPSMNKEGANPEETSMALLEKLCALLKAPATTSEDDVFARLSTALNKAESDAAELATVKARADQLAAAALERDAAEFVGKHGARFGDEAKLKALFVSDRKAAEDLVALLKPPAQDHVRVLNREDGQSPETSSVDASALEAAEKRAKYQRDLVEHIKAAHNLPFTAAWARAEREKPELFKAIVR